MSSKRIYKLKKFLVLSLLALSFTACDDTKDDLDDLTNSFIEEAPVIVKEYGFVLNDFEVTRDTVQPGDTFGGRC